MGRITSVLLALALWLGAGLALAQGGELQLLISKSMGYAAGDQIQGSFNLAVSGPSDIASVTYELDGREMATVTTAPFRYSFDTSAYPLGQHQLSATARSASGATYKSNVVTVQFISASEGWQNAMKIAIPIVVIVLLLMAVGMGSQIFLLGGNKRYEPGAHRNYGVQGGAICRNCGRPFALSLFSPNLLMGKLQRCPYCGKWGIYRPATREALDAAEKAELQGAKPLVHEQTDEERLKREIEQSRYQ